MRKKYWGPFFWLLLTFCTWFLLRESMPQTPPFPHFDKVLHTCGFLVLTLTGIKAYSRKTAWILASMAIYGGGTEILQGLLTRTREASFIDWSADLAGIALAFLLTRKLMQGYGLRI